MHTQDKEKMTRNMLVQHGELCGADVLEIGCGPGRVTADVAGCARRLCAVEVEHDALCVAAATVPGCQFVRASGMALPFRDGTFDAVVFTMSLHHHPDPEDALAEAFHMVGENGRILALEPVQEGEIQQLCSIFGDEGDALAQADAALHAAPVTRRVRREFTTRWRFDDVASVDDYVLGYYGVPETAENIAKIRDFLGPRDERAPLELTDTLRLTCLYP
ncbi:class I SAM-dependent methyltransferase [Desulfobaculum sp. SPO524]|uniref:class I SAM-dependent methyltransferase n=1 Tax=Desulfobaculum sp. SPO524 TaxID=3378071 RepID=UPI003853D365